MTIVCTDSVCLQKVGDTLYSRSDHMYSSKWSKIEIDLNLNRDFFKYFPQ